ncbi:MAG: T9SS type A sorting domain-containing protein, partial [Flavobacteriales bacterium]|nr:T9SS type A sorting domain-containing protein [Flavobacteriales bacterium]
GSGWIANVTCFSPCATTAGTATAGPTSFCPSGNTTLSLSGEDPTASIQWQVSTDGGATWSNIAGATSEPWVQPVAVNSVYHALVTNGCTSTSSETASIVVGCPPIIQPTSGTATASAACGASLNFYDTGGSAGSYSNSENGLITICPSVAGQYVSINFTAFSVENNYDYMYVFDGDDGNADLLGIYTGTGLSGVITASSTNASGCLSFRFTSDGFGTSSGWTGVVTCTGTPAAPPPAASIEDCHGAITICSNSALIGGTTGYGLDELPNAWNSCIADGETQSNWYVFSPATSGTIGFEIVPNSPTDYDWAIWGPYNFLECPAFTNDTPIRCSSSELAGNGNTGLVAPATDVIEQNGEYGGGANENGFLAPMNVIAGEVYVMMLDNWSGSSVGFQLNWNLTNGASLDCSPLPVSLLSYKAQCEDQHTKLEWVTESETNNDYFIIEKNDEHFNFTEIGRVYGAGTTNSIHQYSFVDEEANAKTAYYRLSQVDFDGTLKRHRVVASNCQDNAFQVINASLIDNQLNVLISTSTDERLEIYLYNLSGQLINRQSTGVNAGNNQIVMSNLNIVPGIYMLSIRGEFNTYAKKLVYNR